MKWKKIIAPVVITVVLCIYLISYLIASFYMDIPLWAMLIAIGIPVLLVGVSIYVLIERIKEIRSGEEDDLSKY